MNDWDVESAQRAINAAAPLCAGTSPEEVARELDRWLSRGGASLPEPHYSYVVAEIAKGVVRVILRP